MAQKYMLGISGPSGSGKTTLSRNLQKTGMFECVISHTTRLMRKGEQDGLDYFFVDTHNFNCIDVNDWVEKIEFHGNHYGLHINELKRIWESSLIPIVILDPVGLEQTIDYCRKKQIQFVSLYVDADLSLLTERYLDRLRGDSGADMAYHAQRLNAIADEKVKWRSSYDELRAKSRTPGGVIGNYSALTEGVVLDQVLKLFENNGVSAKSSLDYYKLQKTITDWADATFPTGNLDTVTRKLIYEELPELTLALSSGNLVKIRDEMADVCILFADLSKRLGFDILHEMHKKMETNVNRTWEIDKHGVSHHVVIEEMGQ